MKAPNQLWRTFYATALLCIAVQQLICGDFRPVIIPPSFPGWMPARLICTWVFSIALALASAGIIFKKKAFICTISIGCVLLLLVLLFHIPYTLNNHPEMLGAWTDPLKCFTLSGGAFVVAQSLRKQTDWFYPKALTALLHIAPYFAGITMITFGIDHFLYTDFVATLVPGWLPGHTFFTYLAGVALIMAGLGIVVNFQARLASLLLGVMILIWLIVLHLPRAIADPHSGNGNEWTSVFEALAFSGIAFLIAANQQQTVHPVATKTE